MWQDIARWRVTGRLEGKVALITGAARGQGRSHAAVLATEGADIVAVDLCGPVASVAYPLSTPDDLAETAKLVTAAGRRVETFVGDVRSSADMRAATDLALSTFGKIDIVVANAGIWTPGSVWEMDDQTWADMIDINLTGTFNTVRFAIPQMIERKSGSLVLISSTCGVKALGWMPHYNAAKHGVMGLTRSLALDLGPYLVRANAILPSTVNTPMIHNDPSYRIYRPDLENPTREEAMSGFYGHNAMPLPYVEPEDVSEAVLFLASDASRYVTGIGLPVDLGTIQTTSH
jgi:SDR family mycofactocin-dependent oxidoreductase